MNGDNNMTNIKSHKLIYFLVSIILSIVLIITCFTFSINTVSAAEKQTNALINEIQYRIEESLKTEGAYLSNGMPLAMSSNPYDYIKDNAEYDKLIALGEESLDDLYELQQDKDKYDSFQRYIIAIAIEEITKTDLKQSEEYFWMDADGFSEKWNDFSIEAEENIKDILNNNSLSENEKIENICFYGTLANNINTTQFPDNQIKIIDSAKSEISNSTRNELIEFSEIY